MRDEGTARRPTTLCQKRSPVTNCVASCTVAGHVQISVACAYSPPLQPSQATPTLYVTTPPSPVSVLALYMSFMSHEPNYRTAVQEEEEECVFKCF